MFKILGATVRNISLKKKLFLFLILFVIIPLIGVGAYFNYYFVNSTLEKSYESELLSIRQTEQSFMPIFIEIENMSTKIITDDNIQRLLHSPNRLEPMDYFEKKNEFLGWLKGEKSFCQYLDTVRIFAGDKLFVGVGKIDSDDAALLNELSESSATSKWGKVRLYSSPHEEGFIIQRVQKLRDLDNPSHQLGTISFSVKESIFQKAYSSINLHKGRKTYLIDENNVIISSNIQDSISQIFPFGDDLAKLRGAKYGYFNSTIDNKPHVAFYYAISESPWILVQYVPKEVFVPLQTTINSVILAAISLCILFGFLFSILLRRVVLNPIDELLVEIQKLAQGKFDVALEENGTDEISRIRRAYTQTVYDLKQMIDTVYISEIKKKEAESIALEAQINPHFLYNSLDSIHWLAIKNKDYGVAEQIEALSEIFKHVLRKGKEIVTLAEEIEYVENYMYIQQARYGRRIKLQINVADEMWNCAIPKLIIQPLVENAIVHGIEGKLDGGHVDVFVYAHEDVLHIRVEDDGCDASTEEVTALIHGQSEERRVSALKNIYSRLILKYGAPYGLTFKSESGKTVVCINLPKTEFVEEI